MIRLMKTYCINLAASTDRRSFMQHQFDHLKIPVDWIDAVDGRQLSEDQLKALCRPKKQLMHSGKVLVPGEVGCVLSHHKAYQKLLDSGEQNCLILEDDVDLSRVKSSILEECMTHLKEEAPSVILLFPVKQYYKKNVTPLAAAPFQLVQSFRGLGAYAYMLNRSAAEFLLNFNHPIEHVVDPWNLIQLFYPRAITFYALQPALVTVDDVTNANSVIDQVSARKDSKKRSFFRVIYSMIRCRLVLNEWIARAQGRVVKIPKSKRDSWVSK